MWSDIRLISMDISLGCALKLRLFYSFLSTLRSESSSEPWDVPSKWSCKASMKALSALYTTHLSHVLKVLACALAHGLLQFMKWISSFRNTEHRSYWQILPWDSPLMGSCAVSSVRLPGVFYKAHDHASSCVPNRTHSKVSPRAVAGVHAHEWAEIWGGPLRLSLDSLF